MPHTKHSVYIIKPNTVMQSDRSMKGWGECWKHKINPQNTGVLRSKPYIQNVLELIADLLTFQSFCRNKTGMHTRLMRTAM